MARDDDSIRHGIRRKLQLAGVVQLALVVAIIFLYVPLLMHELGQGIDDQKRLGAQLQRREAFTLAQLMAFELGRENELNGYKVMDAARWLSPDAPPPPGMAALRQRYQSLLLEKIAFNPSIDYMDLLAIHREGYLHIWPFGMARRPTNPFVLATDPGRRGSATQPSARTRPSGPDQPMQDIATYYRYYDAIERTEGVPAIGLILAGEEADASDATASVVGDGGLGIRILHVDRTSKLWHQAVRPGDRLVAINGEPARAGYGRMHVHGWLAGAQRLTLTVAKPGRQIDVLVKSPSAEHVSYIVPLFVAGTRWGVMRLVLSTLDLRKHITTSLRRLQGFKGRTLIAFVFLVAIAFLLGLAVMNVLGRRVAAPIHDLTRHIQRYRETGELDGLDQIPTQARGRRDEVGSLAEAIAELSTRLKTMIVELRKKTRELQKEGRAKDDAYEQLRASQELMEESARMTTLGQMGASVAHEINNRLHPMKLHAESLLMDYQSGRPLEVESIRTILESIERCYQFTETFKQFARRSKPATWQTETLTINKVVDDVLNLTHKQMEWAKVTVRCDPQATQTVRGDPNELGQVVLNLLLNAAEAIQSAAKRLPEGGGVIQVRTFDRGEEVVLEVEDSGPGMATEVQARIFEPFFSTKQPRGTGLGLSISKQILERYQGTIDVTSEPGRGARFRVTLPARA